jgi:hypothetical protein
MPDPLFAFSGGSQLLTRRELALLRCATLAHGQQPRFDLCVADC